MKIKLLALCLLVSQMVAADSGIHTITLKHRLAADVLPQVEAFLPEGATVRAYGDILILKSDRATLANVENLLQKLDVAQRNVTVTVLRTSQALGHHQGASTGLELNIENSIEGSVAIKRWSSKDNRDQDQQYRVRGVAGQPLSINLGQDIPQHRHLVFIDRYGHRSVATDTDYISTDNGFRAVPFLLPDAKVRVEIHPFFSKLSRLDDSIQSSDLITSVVGELGEWLEIGRVTEDVAASGEGYTTYRSHGSQQQIIYLKVETSSN